LRLSGDSETSSLRGHVHRSAAFTAGDRRRDHAYSIFYVGITIGPFQAPVICGTLGKAAAWHYGFAVAGVGMPPARIAGPK
jgi:dipeptide/tripeptide permease